MALDRYSLTAMILTVASLAIAPFTVMAGDETAAAPQTNAADHFGLVEASGLR